MSDPRHSAAAAVAELSTSADLSEATQIEGTSRLISYSGSKQINRVNGVTLSGLTAGRDVLLPRRRRHGLVRHPQLYRPGSREADPLLPAGRHSGGGRA